jgi:hypothetical protein
VKVVVNAPPLREKHHQSLLRDLPVFSEIFCWEFLEKWVGFECRLVPQNKGVI